MNKLRKQEILKSANDFSKEIVNDLEIEFPFDLELLLNLLGINYCSTILEKGLDGKIEINSDEIKIFTNSTNIYDSRTRFTIAHELGHWKLHFCDGSLNQIECNTKDIGDFDERKKPVEYEADLFASELLLPTELFQRESSKLLPSISSLKKLSEKYLTSITSTAIKYIENTMEPCAVVFMQDKRIKWKKQSFTFKHEIREKIDDCLCFDMLDEEKIEIRDSLYMKYWINTSSQKYIWEDVLNFKNLNQQLIILSFYDDKYYKNL